MTETAFTRKFMPKIREAAKALPLRIAIFKHNDFYTGGVPDLSISVKELGTTTWFEIKMDDNVPTPLQQHYLGLLPRAHVITARPPLYYIDGLAPVSSIDFLVEEVMKIATKP